MRCLSLLGYFVLKRQRMTHFDIWPFILQDARHEVGICNEARTFNMSNFGTLCQTTEKGYLPNFNPLRVTYKKPEQFIGNPLFEKVEKVGEEALFPERKTQFKYAPASDKEKAFIERFFDESEKSAADEDASVETVDKDESPETVTTKEAGEL